MATIQDVIRTRKSAMRRRATLKNSPARRRWNRDYESPLQACGEVFENDINQIERIYDAMINRIDNATVTL